MKRFEWDPEKNKQLKAERGVGFEEIEKVVKTKGAIEVTENPNKQKYSHQKIFVVEINDYIYLVPFVEDNEKYFLKTFYPSRKAVKKYLKRNKK